MQLVHLWTLFGTWKGRQTRSQTDVLFQILGILGESELEPRPRLRSRSRARARAPHCPRGHFSSGQLRSS